MSMTGDDGSADPYGKVARLERFIERHSTARKLMEELFSSKGLSLNISVGVDQPLVVSESDHPDADLGRLVLLVLPFVDQDSDVFIEDAIDDLVSLHDDDKREEVKDLFQDALLRVNRGEIELKIDGNTYDAKRTFHLYANGGYLFEKEQEKAILSRLSRNPFALPLARQVFFGYCIGITKIGSHICSLYLEIKQKLRDSQSNSDTTTEKCIFCLSEDAPSRHPEHVIPLSLGVNIAVLPPGIVCDSCNHGPLSDLDNALVNWEPLALLRVQYVPVNPRTGRYPRVTAREFSLERVGPRAVKMKLHGVPRKVTEEIRSGGTEFTLPLTPKGRFDPMSIARSLFKIALEIVVIETNVQDCLDPRYDAARRFVLGVAEFRNYLWIAEKVEPEGEIAIQRLPFIDATIFVMKLMGIKTIFSLEEEPKIGVPPEETGILAFPLFAE